MMDKSHSAIDFTEAIKVGKYLGGYLTRKNGFGPEFWTIEVFDINGDLYGGVEYIGFVEPMVQNMHKDILRTINNEKEQSRTYKRS